MKNTVQEIAMKDTAKDTIIERLAKQRAFFETGQTKDIGFRVQQLRSLKQATLKYREKIEQALWLDLHKSPEEAFLTEISIVISEIDNHVKHLKKWAKPSKVSTPIYMLPSSSKIVYEPLGVALIIAPWNYPFQLLFNTLVGAISAGCCCILKPSPDVPNTAKVMEEIVNETFNRDYISIVQGGKETNTVLLAQRFDIIFFTGSPKVGKVVMQAAAANLTPVVLELGGKSPCIVDAEANLDVAAKRIIWGKLINAGQTCIAPDYLFVHESIKDELLNKMAANIEFMYGSDVEQVHGSDVEPKHGANIKQSRFYPRIVSEKAFERLTGLLNEGTIYTGGQVDAKERFIAPTIIVNVEPHFLIMQEEIFGPILPVMTFKHIDEAISYVNKQEKPLAFYYFGINKKAKEVLAQTTSGGACVNDTIMHVGNHNLPFGGVGNSGMGKYHGKESFLAFSNKRAVVTTPTWLDLPFKYVPFKYFKFIKKFI